MEREIVYSLDQCLASLLAHLLDLFAAPSWAHGPGVAVVVLLFLELDVWAVARYYDGAARFPAAETRARQLGGIFVDVAGLVLLTDRGARRGRAHVVCVGNVAAVVDGERREGCSGSVRHGRWERQQRVDMAQSAALWCGVGSG